MTLFKSLGLKKLKIRQKKLATQILFFCLVASQINCGSLMADQSSKYSEFNTAKQSVFALLKDSLPYYKPSELSFAFAKSKGIGGSPVLDLLYKLSNSNYSKFREQSIKNAFYLYSKYGNLFRRIMPEEVEFDKHKNFSEIKKLLSARATKGQAANLNIVMIKIELGGGHKAALQAMSDSILSDLSTEDRKLINIIPIDFFGSDKERAARDFNKILETEDGDTLARNLWGKPLLERFYDTLPGLLHIQNNITGEIMRHAKTLGVDHQRLHPDIVISAQPFGLRALSRYVISKYNTQLRIVPTDFYLGDWMQRFEPVHQHEPSLRYDASYDSEYIRTQFEEKGIQAVSFFGYPIRKEISALADALYSSDGAKSKKAKLSVDKTINAMTQTPSFGKKGFRSGDQTALIMMGSKGTGAERYISYLKPLFEYAKNLDKSEVVHVFVAALKPRGPKGDELLPDSTAQKKYLDYQTKQQEIFEEVQSAVRSLGKNADRRIRVHLLSFINAKQVGSLIYHGVTITKAGGSTSAEIAALGGRALFNMRISKVAPWERGNVYFLESSGRAIPMSTKPGLESEFVKKGMRDLMRRGRNKPVDRNLFQRTWGSTVLRDLKNILHHKQLSGDKPK